MLISSLLGSLQGIATKGTPRKSRPDVSFPENENPRPFFGRRAALWVALLLVSGGTLALGNHLFSDASPAGAAFRALDGGVITGKSSQVNPAGRPVYRIHYRRPDQSQAAWQVPAQVYRERQSGQSMYFFRPTFGSGGLIVLFFLGILSVLVLLTAAFAPSLTTYARE